ncbi:hypothetical protein [Actinokineospora terrae]|uniref:Uncharacterized protein n=1 Tax=Actinokineospora terrae TaxID=155974 RepID=A0A1H9Q2U9_9PSEU|nr:hypothetical protein [Actinokineospora terrae]SER54425.1 hypothetical protein SAMN04487818_10453 [Actinokineospora terrae]
MSADENVARAVLDCDADPTSAWPTEHDAGWRGVGIWRGQDMAVVAIARWTGRGVLCDLDAFTRLDDRWWPAAATGGSLVDPVVPAHGVTWFFEQQVAIGEDDDLLQTRAGIAAPDVTAVVMGTETFRPAHTTRLVLPTALADDFTEPSVV